MTRLAARQARSRGTRVIYTAHGFHFFKGAPLLNWLIYYPVEKWCARYTDTLITINKEDYERAKKKFKTDVRYVPGVGVDPKKFQKKMTKKRRDALRAEFGIGPDDFVMIYPAELSKRKNQGLLIRSMALLLRESRGIHLLLAGSDSMNGAYQKLAAKLGVDKYVHFLGYRKDIPELMHISDLSVSSSLQEGLPVHIMEAMMAGLPVVATGCRGAEELIQDGIAGILVDFTDDAMVGAIKEAMHINLRDGVAIATIIGRYGIDSIIKQMKELYA